MIRYRRIAVAVTILAIVPGIVLVLTACAPDALETSGMVIVNARVIDGGGGPSRDVNVRVVGDRIGNAGKSPVTDPANRFGGPAPEAD